MSKAEKVARGRVRRLWPILLAAYAAVFARVLFLQTVKADEFREKAASSRRSVTELPAERGRILDRNGRELAFNVQECSVILHTYRELIEDKRLCAQILARHVGMSEAEIYRVLTSGETNITLVDSLSVEKAARLRQDLLAAGPSPKLNGVDVRQTIRRVYPLGSVGAKLVGGLNSKGEGIAGVEMWADQQLAGKAGSLWADCDPSGRPIPTRMWKTVQPVAGSDIVLTIDSRIQYAAEQALKKQVERYSAASGTCIVLDPRTGELLALAEYPSFDPNNITAESAKRMAPSSLIHLFEPGSTMKLVTAAAALTDGLGGVTSVCTGKIPVGKKIIRCPCSVRRREPGMPVTVARMLKYSCNTESTAIARRLGAVHFYDAIKKFGLLEPLEVPGLGRNIGGQAPDPRKYDWPLVRLANVSFGQGVATTRLSLCSAYAAVANGGNLMRPKLLKEVRKGDGLVTRCYGPDTVRRVVSQDVAGQLIEHLEGTVLDGTGKTAQIDGYQVAGKTGSAQIAAEGGGGFIPGAYVASFCGIVPSDQPRLTVLVSVERPRGQTHGATVAAPVFREVASKALWYLGQVSTVRGTRDEPSGRSKVSGGAGTARQG